MTFHAGPVPAGTSLYIPFSTYAGSTGASATCTGLAVTDIEIYKNGSTTQRASDAGIALLDTDGIDFDGITGLHGFSIDLSDNTDSGFFAVGSWYWVVVSAITVDSQTVTFLAATFRIAPAESITGYPKNDVHALGGGAQSLTDLKDFADDGYDPSTNKVQGVLLVDECTENTDMRGTDNAALAATALSNVQWTNALAIALGTAASTVAANLDVAISVIQAQIAALNNLSAKANWFGSALLEVPDSGTRAYLYELVVRDDEDKLVNLDASPTIALVNAAGTDRSALITTTIANPSTGRYTITITAGTSTNNESLKLSATGAVSGETRYAVMGLQVVDYDNATQVALILTRLGTPVVSVSADIATRASQTSVDDIPTNAEIAAGVTLTNAGARKVWTDDWSALAFPSDTAGAYIQAMNTDIDGVVNTLGTPAGASVSADIAAVKADATTLLGRVTSNVYTMWTNLIAMITGSGGTAAFTTTAMANAPAGGGGGGGGDATLANQVLILADLASIQSSLAATTVTVTGYASIDSDGVLQLKRAETATLTFTSDSADLVPDLSAGTTKIVMGIKDTAGRVWLSIEGTVLVATGLQSVRFVLTPSLSLALIQGHHNFDVLAIYGYDAELIPPYATLKTFTSGRVTVTDVFLDPLEL